VSSRRTTRSGPPSRRWRSPTLPLSLSLREGAGVRVPPMPRAVRCPGPFPRHLENRMGQACRANRRSLPARVPRLRRRHPPHRLHHRPGADQEDPAPSR
jgi:hypothetical protein